MISICAVTVNKLGPFIDLFIDNIKNQTELVNEVIFVNNDADKDHYKEWQDGRIVFKEYGPDEDVRCHYNRSSPNGNCIDHAIGMKRAIDKATNDFVFMSDCDVFFYTKLDKFYYELMKQHGLNYVGLSHFSSVTEAFTFFPNVFSAMVKKSDLPDESFLKGIMVIKNIYLPQGWMDKDSEYCFTGQYLMPGKIEGVFQEYPNPEGHYETGAPLYVWAKQANWKWISFQTNDCYNYSTKFCRGNVKIPKIPQQKLLYHATNGSEKVAERLPIFVEVYEKWKAEDDEI